MSKKHTPGKQTAPPPRADAWLSFHGFVQAFTLLTGLAVALALTARWTWLGELAVHFLHVYLMVAVALIAVHAVLRQWRWLTAAAVIGVWPAAMVLPWFAPESGISARGTQLTVLTANVLVSNPNHDAFIELVKQERPDVLFVQEVGPEWDLAFEEFGDAYPHQIVRPQPDNFGIGLYSRHPLENARIVGPDMIPFIAADVIIEKRRVHVLNFHPTPPNVPRLHARRKRQYAWLADYLAGRDDPVIVAGDYNSTMWSPDYRDLIKTTGLRNTRRGYGVKPTWLPLFGLTFILPLDHVCVRGAFDIEKFETLPSIASDHRPLLVSLRISSRR